MKRTKILLVLAVLIVSTTLASAALLQYFGKVTTTMNVKQSVVVGDGKQWYNWDQPLSRDLGDVVHCTDYCYKLWIKNQACKPAIVSIVDTCIASPVWDNGWDSEGVTIGHHVFGDSQTILLVQKQVVFGQSPWLPLKGGLEATLTFNTCGKMFTWSIVSDADLEGYSLIYYANYPEYWSEGPVTVLGGLSGSVEVPTMPYVDDENALRPISDLNEDYEHDYGAKFWLVPTEALVQGQNGWDVAWGMAGCFLFETDLGFYLDCDNMRPVCLPNVYPIFETHVLQPLSTYCWISCYHVVFDIVPGRYAFDTVVDAAEFVEV